MMKATNEYLEESCWEDGECSNECEQCNNITDRCCVSCDGRIGCQYLCHIAKLQQEHERKSDDELIELFSDWAEEDGRFLYAEDRIKLLSGKLAAAYAELEAEKTRVAALAELIEEQGVISEKVMRLAEATDKDNLGLKKFIETTSLETKEWLNGLGIVHDCGWRDAISERLKQVKEDLQQKTATSAAVDPK